jgi:hypothetical protein
VLNAKLWLSNMSPVEYWELSNISQNIAVAILRMTTATTFAKTLDSSKYSMRLFLKADVLQAKQLSASQ